MAEYNGIYSSFNVIVSMALNPLTRVVGNKLQVWEKVKPPGNPHSRKRMRRVKCQPEVLDKHQVAVDSNCSENMPPASVSTKS